MLIHLWRTLQISKLMAQFLNWGIRASINCVRGCTHSSSSSSGFFFPLRRSHLIGPSPIFLEHGALPTMEAWICFPLVPRPPYNLYQWKLNHGSTIWDKNWGVIGNILWNTLGNWGTFWKLDKNRLGTWWENIENNKRNPPPPCACSREKTMPS